MIPVPALRKLRVICSMYMAGLMHKHETQPDMRRPIIKVRVLRYRYLNDPSSWKHPRTVWNLPDQVYCADNVGIPIRRSTRHMSQCLFHQANE